MNLRRLPLLSVLLASAAIGAETPPAVAPAAPPAKKKESAWVFELLPKALQKNPRLELTVITEMTEAGKKLPPVSPAKPAYFEPFSAGPRALGHAPANEHPLKPDQIESLLTRSLAANGYLRAQTPAHPPTILILYAWGSHSLLIEGDDENPTLSGNEIARNMLDRAALVGGEKFAKKLLELFEQADAMSVASSTHLAPGTGGPVMPPEVQAFMNPVEMFKRADAKNEFLVDQTAGNVYYVVASAYDYRSAAANRKILLWRTRMTVAAQGVSQEQSLPTLVLGAAPYFGRDMPEPEILSKRSVPEGSVEIGTPTVVDAGAPAPKKK